MSDQEKSLNNDGNIADISTSTVIDMTPAHDGKACSKEPPSLTKEGSYHASQNASSPSPPDDRHTKGSYRKGRGRGGRGRGRGRGGRGYHSQGGARNNFGSTNSSKMTDSERRFLCGEDRKDRQSQSETLNRSTLCLNRNNLANVLGMNEAQIKGLELLGLSLNSSQAKNVPSHTS